MLTTFTYPATRNPYQHAAGILMEPARKNATRRAHRCVSYRRMTDRLHRQAYGLDGTQS